MSPPGLRADTRSAPTAFYKILPDVTLAQSFYNNVRSASADIRSRRVKTKRMDIQNDMKNAEIPLSRNKETLTALALLCVMWLLPFITTAQAGGLGGVIVMWSGLISSAIGAPILFLPLRRLIRSSMDGKKKIMPRTALSMIFAVFLAYLVIYITPGYINDMKNAAYGYYNEHPQEFENPYEGKTIHIYVLPGPYVTDFVYTQSNPPKQYKGAIVIDFKNGWYFQGAFLPA